MMLYAYEVVASTATSVQNVDTSTIWNMIIIVALVFALMTIKR